MGIFDYVNFKCKCPKCGEPITDFQTKNSGCSFSMLEYYEVDNFYSNCDKCNLWVDFTLKRKKFLPITEYAATYEKEENIYEQFKVEVLT